MRFLSPFIFAAVLAFYVLYLVLGILSVSVFALYVTCLCLIWSKELVSWLKIPHRWHPSPDTRVALYLLGAAGFIGVMIWPSLKSCF